MQTRKVVLGEREYEIQPLSIKASKVWRTELQQPLDLVLTALSQAQDQSLERVEDLINVVRGILPILFDAPDTIFELVLRYSPQLAVERDFLEETAIPEEAVEAFVVCLKMAFPLGPLTQLLGPARATTSSNLPVRRGNSVKPISTS